ncbi:SIR2 family protein [Tessaracoccus caeni]|uniref:SIR2 family protein n=1 Tax=Tessaracoccus caeni TaxID=3031239 RepID=UPI0023DC1956|nr:SIR2 family protein [Tessaracoccus caeni]MDF1490300.1 SIR2 family protein [Tessaracoccus caeni]
MVEILDGQVQDRDIVFSTYVDVSTQTPNDNHLLLAKLDAEQITLNMDTLIEAAGGSAWHLHGRWDEPDTIITTVRQYADGLPPEAQARLRAELLDKRVLVLGYSGRDTDVMPVLARCSPTLLHWVHYDKEPVHATVERLNTTLGDRMIIFNGGAQDVLPLLPHPRNPTPHSPPSTSPPEDRYQQIPLPRRLLAAAAVAYDLGHHEIVTALLSPVLFSGVDEITRLFRGVDEITRRKLVSRAHVRMGEARTALRILLARPQDRFTLRAWPRTANEIAATLHRAKYSRLGKLADTVVQLHPRARDAAVVRRSLTLQEKGDLATSAKLLRGLCDDPHIHQRIGVTGVVDALTAYADTLKLLGSYEEAHAAAFRATTQGEYANVSQRGFAIRRLAEIAHLAGLPSTRISESADAETPERLLEQVRTEAEAFKERDLAFWSAASLAAVTFDHSLDQCRDWLSKARADVPDRGWVAETYLLLVDASVELAWGSPTKALELASQAQRVSLRGSVAYLIADLTRAQCLAKAGDARRASAMLAPLIRRFDKISATSLAARAHLLKAAVAGDPTASHADSYRAAGWNHEATAATRPPEELLNYPWPILL